MIWTNPINQEVVTISVPIKKTASEDPVRRVWTVMETKAANVLKNSYGKWNVEIKLDNLLLDSADFVFRNIKNDNISSNGTSILMDISI